MRFNSEGKYNVPFGHKPDRFSRAYITKISNQIKNVRYLVQNNDWDFRVSDWQDTLNKLDSNDFVYLDPPYIGRHTDYYNSWNLSEAIKLAQVANSLQCGYVLSMWLKNRFRENDYLKYWNTDNMIEIEHFYHIGSIEQYRNSMTEALIVKQDI
jgi:DNA adenine methylase